ISNRGTLVSSSINIPETFQVGDMVPVVTPLRTFTGKISKIYRNKTANSSAYFVLDPSVDYIKGPRQSTGTYSHYVAAAAPKTTAKTSSTMKYLFIGAIVIAAVALAWKYRSKLGIKK
ncbi:MAG: hypothetical protein WCT13_06085, partial [Patescibacteria group bacterium]